MTNSNGMKKNGVKLFLKKEILVDLERNGSQIMGGYCSGSMKPATCTLDCLPPEPTTPEACTSKFLSLISCLPAE